MVKDKSITKPRPDIYFNEFQDLARNPDEHITSDYYDWILEFAKEFKKEPKIFYQYIKESVHEERLNNDCCPLCNEPLKTKEELANKLEAWGKPTEELQPVRYCESCNWKEQD